MKHVQDDNNDRSGHDGGFDQAMRELHAQALTHVSAPVHRRLRAARTAASAAHAPSRGFGWALASGFAALFALVIGLQLRGPSSQMPATTSQLAGLTAASVPASFDSNGDSDNGVAALDENPDFYLWLASNSDAMPAPTER